MTTRKPAPGKAERFDAAYYRRFYGEARTHTAEEIARLAQGIDGLSSWLFQRPLKSVLEIGSGPGFVRDWFARERPSTRFVSTDVSAHACTAYRHRQLDVAEARLRGTFELIICQGVLQYLDDAACSRALENIAAMSSGLLYLEVLTARDLRTVCDANGTDADVHLRTGRFYRTRLAPNFTQAGAGFWVRKDGPIALYELEGPR